MLADRSKSFQTFHRSAVVDAVERVTMSATTPEL